jgi:hypothetical protein
MCAHRFGEDKRIIDTIEMRHHVVRPIPSAHDWSTIRQTDMLPSLMEVKTIEQEYVSPTGRRNLSHRRGRSRFAARLQMGGGYCRLARSDVGKCGRLCHGCLSCV